MFSIYVALFILFAAFQEPALAIKKSYIVYLGSHPHGHGQDLTSADLHRVTESHAELLSSFVGSKKKAKDAIFYTYDKSINGFAALLEEEEAAEIAKHPDVVSVLQNQGRQLHTTHSWDFLMLERNGVIHKSSIWNNARYGEDTIIANLDGGVWPESKSFSGEGYGPIPSKWKGICQFDAKEGKGCNRKLIGARYFNKGFAQFTGLKNDSTFNSPRDQDGHGSHTLSTAAGNFVPGASVFRLGVGTAKGGSPRARAAAYRVCYPPVNGSSDCYMADIMKGFDAAISDGVDVLSVSLGDLPSDYFDDGVAIGAFHAVKNGMVVVASAGNNGTFPGSVTNVAPWIITVAASTIDRQYEADVKLANGDIFEGMSLSSPLPHKSFYKLIKSADAKSANATESDASLCKDDSLDPEKVKGKIVVCLRGGNIGRLDKGAECYRAGAAGMILCNNEYSGTHLFADPHLVPSAHINYTDSVRLFSYLNSTKNPQGLITPPRAVTGRTQAPIMAAFSSRGPNLVTQEILKPDITAPGVNIIAAFSEAVSPTDIPFDKRTTPFYVEQGTSMSCPHVAGVAGLLKTLHPDWSPAAIRSAIMTTARTRDNTEEPMMDGIGLKGTPFSYGAGHIRPNRAQDPGLVYDMNVNDYLDFLCGLGYNETKITRFSGSHYECPKNYSILNMNHPSFSIRNLNDSVTVTRKVKNVGNPGTYVARIRQPPGHLVTVTPSVLKFEKTGEEKSFEVTIKVLKHQSYYEFGELIWSDGSHYVRSPMVIADFPKSS